jgi:hypothetical protein
MLVWIPLRPRRRMSSLGERAGAGEACGCRGCVQVPGLRAGAGVACGCRGSVRVPGERENAGVA